MAAIAVLAASCGGGEEAVTTDRPEPGDSFQWQLADLPVDTSVSADVYDVDLFETPADTVDELHDDGRFVICYFSAGSFEPFRDDSDQLPDEVVGDPLEGFPDERWLDVREVDALAPIIEARLDRCADKGFDGVEFDNVDGFANDSGFDLTAEDQLEFNRWLASEARERGLSPGLKNALDLAAELVDDFDWGLVEECVQFDECDLVAPFVDSGKAVFVVEYEGSMDEVCAAVPDGVTAVLKDVELTVELETCST